MEKYSAYRDAGTGIQPFLTPLAPASASGPLDIALVPLKYLFGTLRVLLCLITLLLYVVIVQGICLLFYPIAPLHRILSSIFTAIIARLSLLFMGFYWISVTMTPRKRGRAAKDALNESWSPRTGDLIISNWASYVEILWLAFRFNPTFVLPIATPPPQTEVESPSPSRVTGRRTGTGSANVSLPTTASTPRSRSAIQGFREVSLLKILASTGRIPPFGIDNSSTPPRSLEDIRKSARGPVVAFPECTTSNGRALLRFAQVFGDDVKLPVKQYGVYVMSVRYDAPTTHSPTLTLSLPPPSSSPIPNPLAHLFSTALNPASRVSIRLLPPSESPSSGSFIVSDIVTSGGSDRELLREACEALVAGLGKLKRTQLGWEEKAGLMQVYYGSSQH
ncbi:hypothetical protein DL93DRAFT_2086438, partial [Clavulina sp. PMI_390]